MFGSGIGAYKVGMVFAVLTVASASIVIWQVLPMLLMPTEFVASARLAIETATEGDAVGIATMISSIAPLVLVVSAIITATTVLLGWRTEKQQMGELKLIIAQLEFEITRLRQAAGEQN